MSVSEDVLIWTTILTWLASMTAFVVFVVAYGRHRNGRDNGH